LALGFESSRSPAKFAKRFESSNPDSRIRLTTTYLLLFSFGAVTSGAEADEHQLRQRGRNGGNK
jgi:hypothetical protein